MTQNQTDSEVKATILEGEETERLLPDTQVENLSLRPQPFSEGLFESFEKKTSKKSRKKRKTIRNVRIRNFLFRRSMYIAS